MAAFFKDNLFNLAEDEISFESFTRFSLLLFKLVGFDFQPMAERADRMAKLTYILRSWIAWVCLLTFVIGIFQLVVMTFIVDSNDFVGAASALQDAISVFSVTLKAFVTFSRKKELFEIFNDMKVVWDHRNAENRKHKVKNYLNNYHRLIKTGARMNIFFLISVLFMIIPYLFNGTMKLAINFWFPFDAYQLKNFPFAYLWVDWITVIGLLLLMASDSLLCALITVLSMEFDFLKNDFSNLSLHGGVVSSQIKSLIERHNVLLDLCGKLQKIYSPTFLGSFALSSMIMCICIFQLSTGNADYILYATYLCILAGQVFVFCYFGQKLTDSSLGVADGIYENNWPDYNDIKFKKQIVLIIIRAQKPSQLTAMKFAKVSLESFTTVRNKILKKNFNHFFVLI